MIRLTPDQQKKGAVIALFLLAMGAYAYFQLRVDSPPSPPAVPVIATTSTPTVKTNSAPRVNAVPSGNVAKNLGTTSAQLDPTLRMEAMLVTESLVYSGNGRNIFSMTSVPVDIPKPIAPVRPKGPVVPPPPPVQQGPPPPPPIDLKFFGTATAPGGKKQAFLLHGDDVFLAVDGDIVVRKYKVISVSVNSILVEDLANNNRQTLPLLAR